MAKDIFGNLTFGETTKLLVSIIGQDAIRSLLPPNEQETFDRTLNRIFKEENVEFAKLATFEKDNPQDYSKVFFTMLKDKYNVPEFISDFFDNSVWQLFHSCLSHTPYEREKASSVKYLFCKQIFESLYAHTEKNSPIFPKIRKDDLVVFLSKTSSLDNAYKTIFNHAAKIMTNGNKSLLFERINKFTGEKSNLIGKNINRWDKGTKPTWKSIKPILDFFSENNKQNLIYRLLAVYFLKNTRKIFDDLKLILKNEFDKIMNDVIRMLNEKLRPEVFYNTAFGKVDVEKYFYLDYIRQSNTEKLNKELLERIEQDCPNCKKFFNPWLQAKTVLFANIKNINYKEIRKYYREAFDNGKYYSGCFTWQFLLEAIALEQNYNRMHNNEYPGNLNDYYAFGYALEMFTGQKEVLLEIINCMTKHLTLCEQYALIDSFYVFLWDNILSKIPYRPPQTEYIFKSYYDNLSHIPDSMELS